MYSSMAADVIRLPQAVYTFWEARSALYTRCTTPNGPHGNAPLGGAHSAANETFVHALCRAVTLHGVVHLSQAVYTFWEVP